MATLDSSSTNSFNAVSGENGDALPEEKSLSIDYSEDLWLAEDSSSGPYSQQPSKVVAPSTGNSVNAVSSQNHIDTAANPASLYQNNSHQHHWNQMGDEHRDEEAGGTILQPSTTTYINGSIDQAGMDDKDFAQLVPAGTYVDASGGVGPHDPHDKTFTALMPAAGLGVNGEELQGGFTTMLQDGQQQMVFYGSGDPNVDSSHHHQQLMAQQGIAFKHQGNGVDVSGEEEAGGAGCGEGNLYVAMENADSSQMGEGVKMEVDGVTVYGTQSPIAGGNGNFQTISTLPFVQNSNGGGGSFATFNNSGGQSMSMSDANDSHGEVSLSEDPSGGGQDYQEYDQGEGEGEDENSNLGGEIAEFACRICHENFEDQGSLDSHMENHPPAKSFICQTCTKSFATKRYLKYHRKNHCKRASSYEGRSEGDEAAAASQEIKRFSCNVCKRPFRVLKCMKVHKKKKHGIVKDFTCPGCAITFETSEELVDHECQPKSPASLGQQQHEQQQQFESQQQQQQQQHKEQEEIEEEAPVTQMRVPTLPPPAIIPPPPPLLNQQKKKKSKIRQTKPMCDICGKLFGDRISMDIHRVKHIEEEFYPCDMCDLDTQSDSPTHLAVHFRIKFFTDDNQHILEDQKAAVEAMRVEEMTISPHHHHQHNHGLLNNSSPSSSAQHHHQHNLHHHQHSSTVGSPQVVYANPSSIIAQAAASTNIIDDTEDGGIGDEDSLQYLDQTGNGNLNASEAASSSDGFVLKSEPSSSVMSNFTEVTVLPGQSVGDMNQSFVEYTADGQEIIHQQPMATTAAGLTPPLSDATPVVGVTKTVIKKKPHHCDICNKSFAEPSKLELHYKTNHVENRPFHCEVCDKSFFTKWKLQRHTLSHLEIKPHSCPACSKSFVERGKLEAHYRTHLGTKPYKCEHCTKAFTVKSQLTIHVRRIHSADQPFACGTCGKAFLWKSGLDKHMRKHTREKPFVCSHCGQKYSQKSNLLSHLSKVHDDHPAPEQVFPVVSTPQQSQPPEDEGEELQNESGEIDEDSMLQPENPEDELSQQSESKLLLSEEVDHGQQMEVDPKMEVKEEEGEEAEMPNENEQVGEAETVPQEAQMVDATPQESENV